MTTLQFQCPQCAGLFQTDSSFAGQTVGCPMCGCGVTLPPPEMFAPSASSPPAPSAPPVPTGAPAGAMPLACPMCGGGFLIPPELAGQQVACPHCHQPVHVPGEPAKTQTPASVAPAPAPKAPEPTPQFNRPPQSSLYPPGFEPPGARSTPQPRPTEKPPAAPAPAAVDNRFPPGFTPPKPASAPASERAKPVQPKVAVDNFLPPGMGANKPVETPTPTERPRPAPAPAPVPTPAPAPRSKVDDLLPPGAEADDLLPPGTGEFVSPAKPTSIPGEPLRPVMLSKPQRDDSLLPPGMEEAPAGGSMQQVALPEEEMARQLKALNRPLPPTNVPKDAVLIETEDGGYVALREPVKTVGTGANERELHVLTPEQKAKRRIIRNLVVFSVGLTVLFVIFMLLMRV